MNTMKRFSFLAALGLAILGAGTAQAQEPIGSFITFGRPFSYTAPSGTATLAADTSAIFAFDTGPLAGIGIDSTMTFLATTSTAVEPDVAPVGGNFQVIADTTPGSIEFTATESVSSGGVSVSSGDVRLTVSFRNAVLRADTATTAGIEAADGSLAVASPPVQVVDISSPVLGISFFNETFSLALDSIMPGLSVPTSDGFFGDFDSQLEGAFSGNIPEPATLAMFGIGLIGLPTFAAIRRRRTKA